MSREYWTRVANDRRQKFRKLLDRDDGRLLDLKFMDTLADNKRRLSARQGKRQIVITTATLLLFVAVALPDVHLSFTGVGVEAKQFREILLVILSAVSAMRFFDWGDSVQTAEILQAYVSKVAGNDPTLRDAMGLRFGLGGGSLIPDIQPKDLHELSAWTQIFLVLFAKSIFWVLRASWISMVLIQIAGIVSILWDPTISRLLSIFVSVYVILVVVMIAGLTLVEGPRAAKET